MIKWSLENLRFGLDFASVSVNQCHSTDGSRGKRLDIS